MRDRTIKFYESFGFDISENDGGELIAECLLCGKKKFYIADDGAFDCKGCSTRGNARTIAKVLHDKIYKKSLSLSRKKELCEWRGMPVDCFDYDMLGFDPIYKEFTAISPLSKSLKAWGLKRTRVVKAKRRFLSIPGGEMGLIGAELIPQGGKDPVYICEGEWDFLSLRWLLKANALKGSVVGVPGATTFKDEWVEWFRGKNIRCMLDNDKGGLSGNGVLRKRLGSVASSIGYLHWPKDLEGKWDVDKLIKESLSELSPKEIYDGLIKSVGTTIQGSSEDGKKERRGASQAVESHSGIDRDAVPAKTYDEFHAVFSKWYHMTQALKDGLDIEMAILFATKMNLRPAPWIYIVGPSATGKSTIVESLDAIEEAVFLSEIRGTTLVSGFSMQGGSDPSILARFNDFGNGASKSVLLVGDMSVTLSQGSEEVMRVQSLLRDISNGRFYNSYGNGVIRDYPKLHVSIIAGVTMEVWKIDTPEMGERFVKTIICKPSNREKDDRIASEKAVRNTPFRKEMERETKEAVIGAMKREIASPIPYPGEDQMQVFIDLGTFCERIRGSSKVDKFTNINETNTNHAGGTRFATTLAVIAAGAATHLECSPVDERVLRLVRKITRDTPIHYRMILVKALYDMYKVQPFLVRDVIPHIYRDMTIETAEMEISALFRMSVVHKVKVKNKDGQERTAFELDSKIYNLIRKLKLFDDIDQSDPFSVSFTKKPMVFTMKRKSS
jgi:hypothetical protein